MSLNLAQPPILSTPLTDTTPVERAVVLSLADGYPPETYLWIECHRPDGSMRLWHAWTPGGDVLGDQVDDFALVQWLDAADWLETTARHEQVDTRGRIIIRAYPLRPVLADVRDGVTATEDRRGGVERVLHAAAELAGIAEPAPVPRWLGFGPRLATRPY